MISEVLENLTKFSIEKFFDALAEIKRMDAETKEAMSQFEANTCTERVQRRWDLQVLSHGNSLKYCMSEATRILNGEYYDLNYFDKDGARVSNHVQNQGLNIISQNDVMDSNIDFYILINRRLRDLLMRAAR